MDWKLGSKFKPFQSEIQSESDLIRVNPTKKLFACFPIAPGFGRPGASEQNKPEQSRSKRIKVSSCNCFAYSRVFWSPVSSRFKPGRQVVQTRFLTGFDRVCPGLAGFDRVKVFNKV
jgi:hypothetical protein